MLSFGISWALSYFCATVWPTYASFKALGTANSVDDTQWLTYWVVYSFLTTIEAMSTSLTTWFPLYYELRLLFVLWLVLPQTKGAQLVYENYIKPLMRKYGSSVDPAFKHVEKAAEQAGRFAGQHAPSYSSTTSQKYQPPTTPPGYSQPNRY